MPAPARRRGRDPARAAAVLEAAARVFAKAGFAAVSMEEVAAEAGVSKLVVYRHYGSKRDLYLAVIAQVRSRLDAVRDSELAASDQTEDPLAAAADGLLAVLKVAREVPDAYRLVHRHAAHEPEFADLSAELGAQNRATADVMLRPFLSDPLLREWMGAVLSTTVDEAILAWLDHGDPERDHEMAQHLARVLGGMVGAVASSPESPRS